MGKTCSLYFIPFQNKNNIFNKEYDSLRHLLQYSVKRNDFTRSKIQRPFQISSNFAKSAHGFKWAVTNFEQVASDRKPAKNTFNSILPHSIVNHIYIYIVRLQQHPVLGCYVVGSD